MHDRSFVRSFVQSFVCWFGRWIVYSSVIVASFHSNNKTNEGECGRYIAECMCLPFACVAHTIYVLQSDAVASRYLSLCSILGKTRTKRLSCKRNETCQAIHEKNEHEFTFSKTLSFLLHANAMRQVRLVDLCAIYKRKKRKRQEVKVGLKRLLTRGNRRYRLESEFVPSRAAIHPILHTVESN